MGLKPLNGTKINVQDRSNCGGVWLVVLVFLTHLLVWFLVLFFFWQFLWGFFVFFISKNSKNTARM